MDSKEQARKIYELCITNLNDTKNLLTYGEVLKALGYKKGVSGQAIRFGLELVLISCADSGLPILTSTVVNQLTGSPSAGEYPNKSWEKEAQRVFSHKDWPDVDEIDWKYIWENRKKLSNKFGTPGYWGN